MLQQPQLKIQYQHKLEHDYCIVTAMPSALSRVIIFRRSALERNWSSITMNKRCSQHIAALLKLLTFAYKVNKVTATYSFLAGDCWPCTMSMILGRVGFVLISTRVGSLHTEKATRRGVR